MTEHAATWQQICAGLDISTPAFETWLRPVELVSVEAGLVTLAAESQFNAEHIAKRYAGRIAEAASQVLGQAVRVKITVQGQPLNNLNIKLSSHDLKLDPPSPAGGDPSFSNRCNLNNLKQEQAKQRGGVPRQELYTNGILKNAMAWGVEEWLVQVCIRDYGIDAVKRTINRLYQLPDGYFKPQYGQIPAQRGRLFNKEMQKLKAGRQVS